MFINARNSTVRLYDTSIKNSDLQMNRLHLVRGRAGPWTINRKWRNSETRQAQLGIQTRVGALDVEAQRFVQELIDKLMEAENKNARLLCEMMLESREKSDASMASERAEMRNRKNSEVEIQKKDIGEKGKAMRELQESKDWAIKMLILLVLVLTLVNIALALKI